MWRELDSVRLSTLFESVPFSWNKMERVRGENMDGLGIAEILELINCIFSRDRNHNYVRKKDDDVAII